MQKITLFLICVISSLFSVASLQAQNLDKEIETIITPLIASISSQPVKNVAISDFTSLDGTSSELGKYLAEEFSFSLVNAKKSFIVIDRSRVSALLKENGLGNSGMMDPNTIAKLGKMKGIDAVIAGTLTSTGNSLRLIIKVWNLETQGLMSASKGDISKTPMIIELEGKTVSNGTNSNNNNVVTSKSTPQLPAISKVTKGEVTFELFECKQSGQNIRFQFQVRSDNKDVDLSVYGGGYSRIIDGVTGNEFNPQSVKIADKEEQKTLIAGYPVKLIIEFNNVNIPISIISKLEMATNVGPIEFRNIKVK